MDDSFAEVPVDAVDPETLWGSWEPVVDELREVDPSDVAKLLLNVREVKRTFGRGYLDFSLHLCGAVWKDSCVRDYFKAARKAATSSGHPIHVQKEQCFWRLESVLVFSLQQRGRLTKAAPRGK